MVSRRNFFTVTVIMLILLFMFQVPEIVKDKWNHYGINRMEEETKTEYTEESVYLATKEDVSWTGRYAVYIGDCEDTSVGAVVDQWAFYTKRYLAVYPSLEEYEKNVREMPEVLLIDSEYIDWETDALKLLTMAEQGTNMIFCNLPDYSVIEENENLMELLGIRHVWEPEVKVDGIRLFEGLLFGGEKYYVAQNEKEEKLQDLELEMPWYYVSSGSKTYMVGFFDKDTMDEMEIKNEELPAVIWRNSINDAKIFVVNGNYLENNSGIGFLDGMMAEMKDYEIYPVINAQNLVMVNYPGLTEENNGEMMERYSQSLKAVYRDIIWPGITTILQRENFGLTCMLAPQTNYLDENEPEEDMLVYYMKLLQEQNAEAGLSGRYKEALEISGKLSIDETLFDEVVPDYSILSFYQGELTQTELKRALSTDILTNLRTVYQEYDANERLVDYIGEDLTVQQATNDGYSHTFSENLRMNGIQTALAYTSISTDIDRAAYPETKEDSWEKLFDTFASNTNTYWKGYDVFDGTTLAESDERIRTFLALNYTQERKGDTLYMELEDVHKQAWFILRTHGETIVSTKGADFSEIEENAYLIEATEKKVQIKLVPTDERFFYE